MTTAPAQATEGPTAASGRRRRYSIAICLALAIVTAWLYWPIRHHEFIALDDPDYLLTNPSVRTGITAGTIHWAFTRAYAGNWHPLTWISHMLDCQLFGLNAGAHHLVNAGFHVVNSLLLFLLLQRLTRARWRSAFVAALFALHPLHVESVAWISERKDVLSTLFFLLTLMTYERYVSSAGGQVPGVAGPPSNARRRTSLFYGLSLFLFALGLMSKPMLVTLPFVLLLLDFWPLGRWPHPALKPGISGARKLVLEKIPFFVLSAISCAVTLATQSAGRGVGSTEDFPVTDRIANALNAWLGYIEKMFWPARLSPFYPFPTESHVQGAAFAFVVLAAVTVCAVLSARRRPYLITGWFWYVGTLVPVIGLVQVGAQAMADRYTYLPLIGLFVIIAWGAADLAAGWKLKAPALAAAGALIIVACGVVTHRQVGYWRSSKTLFGHAVQVDERNYVGWTILGDLLRLDGKPDQAIEYLNRAAQLRPNSEIPWYGLAMSLIAANRLPEADAAFQMALQRSPANAHILTDYGRLLVRLDRLDEAQAQLQKAKEANPFLIGPRLEQVTVFQKRMQLTDAVKECEEILQLEPANEIARVRLAAMYSGLGKPDQAVLLYRQVVQSNPANYSARLGLGLALVEMQDLAAAESEFSTVLRADPKNAAALDGLGFVLAQKGQLDEAKAKFAESLQLDPGNAMAHLHYAMCLSSQGRSREAIGEYRKTLELDTNRVVALNNLAWTLASHPDPAIRNGREAVELAERACRLTNDRQPFYLGTLAAAYAEAGRFDEAVATAEKARDLAQQFGWNELVARNEQLLQLYRARMPYHEPEQLLLK